MHPPVRWCHCVNSPRRLGHQPAWQGSLSGDKRRERKRSRAGDDRPGGLGSVRRFVIVESPTKARKIAGYLGPNYIVESSRGHIRDLPKGAADVPAKYKAGSGPAPVSTSTTTSNRS